VNEELEELRRLGDSFAATIREQGRQVESGMRSISSALDQAASRLAAVMGGAVPTAAPSAGGAAAVAGGVAVAAGVAATAPGGIALVRIVNDRVPVLVLNPGPAPAQPSVWQNIAAGAGGFLGGLFGGIFSGFMAPIAGFADIVALMVGLPGILDRVMNILREVRAIARELVSGVRGLIILLFSELTAAGIFPVSRLIASLLFLIDRGITLVLMHIQPIILWLERVIEAITDWLGRYFERIATYITNLVNALTTFLAAYVTYLIDSILRPAVDAMVRDALRSAVASLAGALFAAVIAAGDIIAAAIAYAAQLAWRGLIDLLNRLPGVSIPVPAAPTAPSWGAIARSGFAAGRTLGSDLAEALFGPAPVRPRPGAGTAPGAPGTPPTYTGPRFGAPRLRLPDMPGAAPQLERLLETPPATTGPEAERPGAQRPVTVNGGVSVAIRSETVSMENAEETARVIAAHIADELQRVIQSDRFTRGLPTAPVA